VGDELDGRLKREGLSAIIESPTTSPRDLVVLAMIVEGGLVEATDADRARLTLALRERAMASRKYAVVAESARGRR
jgi:hypothetical protein